MPGFKKYQHVERFGTSEVEGIEYGEVYIFPKIDGTNASAWLYEGAVYAGSRNRELTHEKDNAGFLEFVSDNENIRNLLEEMPNIRLFGEWLVPHSLKTYRDDAWRRFYVFDVVLDTEDGYEYLPYEHYKDILDRYEVDYIPPLCTIRNATYERIVAELANNVFLVQDGKGHGEGVVIKRYDYVNKYGRTVWAKIVTSEFKEKHAKFMGAPSKDAKKLIEESIAGKYVTKALCEKVVAKIKSESDGFRSSDIPRLIQTVFYDLVREESWNFVKEHKNPTINFRTLHHFTVLRIKENLPHLF